MLYDVPLSVTKYSAYLTFEDMVMGESRYFIPEHLQLFRVFAGRLNKDPDRKSHCVIMFDDDHVCVSKTKPLFKTGTSND